LTFIGLHSVVLPEMELFLTTARRAPHHTVQHCFEQLVGSEAVILQFDVHQSLLDTNLMLLVHVSCRAVPSSSTAYELHLHIRCGPFTLTEVSCNTRAHPWMVCWYGPQLLLAQFPILLCIIRGEVTPGSMIALQAHVCIWALSQSRVAEGHLLASQCPPLCVCM
jgi:hypothetical protein